MLCVGVLSSACSSSGPAGAMTAEEATAEYFAEAENWELAPGWEWPKDPGIEDIAEDGNGIAYEGGYGKVNATHYWHCSWSRALIEAENDEERQVALDEVNRVTETYYYTNGLTDDGRSSKDELLAQVNVGDFTEFARITDLNCPASPA